MSHRDLSTPSMISLSSDWIDPAGTRGVIEAIPQAAPLIPTLIDVHRKLLRTQAQPKKVSAELTAIQDEQAEEDGTHDRKARGVYHALTAFADLVDDAELAAACLALRDKIFLREQGLRVIQISYAEEAGEAKLVEERLDESDRALLKKLPYPEGKLLDAHKARVKAAARLGELEQQKSELTGKEEEKEATKQADVLKARNAWIRAARALASMIDLVPPSAAVRKRILGRLEEAELKVSRPSKQKPPSDGAAGSKAAPDMAQEPPVEEEGSPP